jgi:hypothetical protein
MTEASNPPRCATYESARELIQTGDLIAIRSDHGGFTALTRWFTGSPYTHTGIALWENGRLLMAENRHIASLVPLSQYDGKDFDVLPCPVNPQEAHLAAYCLLGRTIKYDGLDLLRIALHELLGVPLPAQDNAALICSALSAAIYRFAGWQPPGGFASIPTPRDLVQALGALRLEVRHGG